MSVTKSLLAMLMLAIVATGCSTEPTSDTKREELNQDVDQTMQRLKLQDADLQEFLNSAYAYAIFPSVGKGAIGVGGAYGRGQVYEKGAFVGYTDLSQGTVGLQLGGQTYAELICFETKDSLNEFESGNFAFSANASATALKSGAARAAKYTDGVVVFVLPQAGLMFEASIGGQSFTYQPK